MNILKQSTAATIKLGPFVDDTDGKTAETALTIGQADIRLSKNGGDIAQTNNATGATHDELGYYDIPLNTTDTGTLGRLRVLVSKAGALPVWQDFVVVTANVFDTFCSTGSLNVNAASLSTDAITAASVKAEAVTKIQNGLATPTNITAGTITTVTNLTNLPTMPTDWVTAAGLKADAVAEIQDGVTLANTQPAITWGQQKIVANVSAEGALDIRNNHSNGAGIFNSGNVAQYNHGLSVGVVNEGPIDVIGFDSAIATASNLQTVDDIVDTIKTDTAAILADTGTDGVVLKAAGLSADAVAEIADGVWDEAISGHTTATTFGGKNQKVVPSETIGDYKADVSGIPAAVWGYATRTLSSFGSLIADIWSHVTRTLSSFGFTVATNSDANVTAIKAKTDNLPATPASAGEYTAAIAAIPTAPLLAANYTAPDNASIATIKAKTNLIPANPAVADEYDAALAAIQADLDNPNQYKADVSALMLASSYVAPNNAGITAIKAKTDNLPANTATALAAIQSDLDNPAQYKADVSGLATQASVNAIPTTPLLAANYTAPDNASIAAILEDTGTTIPATLAGLATSTEVGAITMLDEVVVGSYTVQDILKILAAKMVGKASGGGTTTIKYRGVDDTSDVIIETVDSNGNRSAVTLTV